MQAVHIRHRASTALQEIPVPPVGPGEERCRLRSGHLSLGRALSAGDVSTGPLPLTLGHEVAGVVEAVGPRRHGKPGDRVLPALPRDVRPVRALQPRPRSNSACPGRCSASTATAATPSISSCRSGAWCICRTRSRSTGRDHDVLVLHVVPRAAQGPAAARGRQSPCSAQVGWACRPSNWRRGWVR